MTSGIPDQNRKGRRRLFTAATRRNSLASLPPAASQMVCNCGWCWMGVLVLPALFAISMYVTSTKSSNCAGVSRRCGIFWREPRILPLVQRYSAHNTSDVDYKQRFFNMPLDLQDLSPKPDFENHAVTQRQIPNLVKRADSAPSSPNTPSFNEKRSRSSDEGTLAPPSPGDAPNNVAPWEKPTENEGKPLHATPAAPQSGSFTYATNERNSTEVSKQPFRDEVPSDITTLITG
jgi:hypothetical protein